MKVLTINPGSTSTKIVVFDNNQEIARGTLYHDQDQQFQNEFSKAGVSVFAQYDYRKDAILEFLKDNNIDELDAVVGRGGMMMPIPSGTYSVTDDMIEDLKERPLANHASNLGASLALAIGEEFGVKENSFIVDPVVTDELLPKNKLTGMPEIKRFAAWHALNQKAVAREYAKDIGKKYEDLNLIIGHMGGGASFGAHRKGRTINVYNALSGEGPFTPERSGAVPAKNIIEMCFSGDWEKKDILHLVAGGGGMYAHLKSKDLREFLNEDGNEFREDISQEKKDVIDAMLAGYSRSICSLIPDFEGEQVDQIILTGGFSNSTFVVNTIKKDLTALNIPVSVYPGELEMEALRDGALRVLNGEETVKDYSKNKLER
jgi:butyrate kinase